MASTGIKPQVDMFEVDEVMEFLRRRLKFEYHTTANQRKKQCKTHFVTPELLKDIHRDLLFKDEYKELGDSVLSTPKIRLDSIHLDKDICRLEVRHCHAKEDLLRKAVQFELDRHLENILAKEWPNMKDGDNYPQTHYCTRECLVDNKLHYIAPAVTYGLNDGDPRKIHPDPVFMVDIFPADGVDVKTFRTKFARRAQLYYEATEGGVQAAFFFTYVKRERVDLGARIVTMYWWDQRNINEKVDEKKWAVNVKRLWDGTHSRGRTRSYNPGNIVDFHITIETNSHLKPYEDYRIPLSAYNIEVEWARLRRVKEREVHTFQLDHDKEDDSDLIDPNPKLDV